MAANKIRNILLFIFYTIREYRGSKIMLVLTFILLFLDYLAMSLMLPLSNMEAESKINFIWKSVCESLSFEYNVPNLLWVFLCALAFRTVLGYFHSVGSIVLAKNVQRKLADSVFEYVIKNIPMSDVYKNSIGYYTNLAGEDSFKAGSLINQFFQILSQFSAVIVGLGVLWLYSSQALVVTLLFLIGSGLLVYIFLAKVVAINSKTVSLRSLSHTAFLEAINGLRSVRVLNAQSHFIKSFSEKDKAYVDSLKLIESIKISIKSVPALLALLLGLIWLNPWFQFQKTMTPESIFAGVIVVVRLFASLGSLMNILGGFVIDSRAANDLKKLISMSLSLKNGGGNFNSADILNIHTLTLKNISCGYDDNCLVIDNFSYEFKKGCSYAIVGPSGIGKSTIADLLCGLLPLKSGEVLINGVSVDSIFLARNVKLIEQHSKLFSFSIRENLSFGDDVSDAELMNVLNIVGLKDLILSMPEGLSTPLDYMGDNISGGQRQRLSIARALLKCPQVLILDEATSALDAENRDNFLRNILRSKRDSILVFITHDSGVENYVDHVIKLGSEKY